MIQSKRSQIVQLLGNRERVNTTTELYNDDDDDDGDDEQYN